MKNQGTKNMWRWWCGGGVIAIAVVLGCASAVEFKDSGREAGTKAEPKVLPHQGPQQSVKRGLAYDQAEGAPHNGGKPDMPVTASFDGDMIAHIKRDTTLIVTIRAEADISRIRGSIEGIGELKGRVDQPLPFTELAAGETQSIEVRVPPVTGSLIVKIMGLVGGSPMSTALDLKINPKSLSTSSFQSGGTSPTEARDVGPTGKDATGQTVRSMKAKED